MKFSTKDFFSKFPQFPADLVTFTEEILSGKLHFLCSVYSVLSCQIVVVSCQIAEVCPIRQCNVLQ